MKNVIRFIFGLASLVMAAQALAVPSGPVLVGGCSLDDLTTSTQCVGVYNPGNDAGMQSIFGDTNFQTMFPGDWNLLAKTEDPGWNFSNAVNLTLTNAGGTSGGWSVDMNAWDGFVQGEIIAVLKAGNQAAAYEIDLSVTSGRWNVTDRTPDDSGWDGSGLSHFSFWTTQEVPEPGMLALLSLGLIGLVVVARRKV